MNKRDLYRHILVLSASKVLMNVTCKNTFFTQVAVGWDGLLICTQERMNRRDLDFKIAANMLQMFYFYISIIDC